MSIFDPRPGAGSDATPGGLAEFARSIGLRVRWSSMPDIAQQPVEAGALLADRPGDGDALLLLVGDEDEDVAALKMTADLVRDLRDQLTAWLDDR